MSRRAHMRTTRLLSLATFWFIFATESFAQNLGQGSDVSISWMRFASALAFCLIIGVLGALALKARRSPGFRFDRTVFQSLIGPLKFKDAGRDNAGRLVLVETLRVSHQLEVHLMMVEGRQLVIATTPHGSFPVTTAIADAPADRHP